jgi:thioesterase domain-containing protein
MPIDLGWSKYINLSSSKEVIGDHFSILRKPYVIEIAQIINNIV